jgi:hypothetical protein
MVLSNDFLWDAAVITAHAVFWGGIGFILGRVGISGIIADIEALKNKIDPPTTVTTTTVTPIATPGILVAPKAM